MLFQQWTEWRRGPCESGCIDGGRGHSEKKRQCQTGRSVSVRLAGQITSVCQTGRSAHYCLSDLQVSSLFFVRPTGMLTSVSQTDRSDHYFLSYGQVCHSDWHVNSMWYVRQAVHIPNFHQTDSSAHYFVSDWQVNSLLSARLVSQLTRVCQTGRLAHCCL